MINTNWRLEFLGETAGDRGVGPVVVHLSKYRLLVVEAYKAGIMSWGEAFCRLYNAGWRGQLANPSVTT